MLGLKSDPKKILLKMVLTNGDESLVPCGVGGNIRPVCFWSSFTQFPVCGFWFGNISETMDILYYNHTSPLKNKCVLYIYIYF